MLTALRGYSIVEYQAPEDWKKSSGIILPSAATMRGYLRSKESKTFDINKPPPDIYRWGRFVDGALPIEPGAFVYFNRHDADEFEYDGKTFHRINNLNALAYYTQPV